jgi:hypothetical protein
MRLASGGVAEPDRDVSDLVTERLGQEGRRRGLQRAREANGSAPKVRSPERPGESVTPLDPEMLAEIRQSPQFAPESHKAGKIGRHRYR